MDNEDDGRLSHGLSDSGGFDGCDGRRPGHSGESSTAKFPERGPGRLGSPSDLLNARCSEFADLTDADIARRCDVLAGRLLDSCRVRDWKIATAESLTGGLLADAFVRIPGASTVFLGSAVTYDINAKASVLGVDASLLEREGAVHPEVARQMARFTARLYDQPKYGGRIVGLSTTGVAGPGPDGDKPAGLVYAGVSLPDWPADRGSDCDFGARGEQRDVSSDEFGCSECGSDRCSEETKVMPSVGQPAARHGARHLDKGRFTTAFEYRLPGSRQRVRRLTVLAVLENVTRITVPVEE